MEFTGSQNWNTLTRNTLFQTLNTCTLANTLNIVLRALLNHYQRLNIVFNVVLPLDEINYMIAYDG